MKFLALLFAFVSSAAAQYSPPTFSPASPGAIGVTTPSSGAFTSLTANGLATLTNSTSSIGPSTGALVVTGGIGVAGAISSGNVVTWGGTITNNQTSRGGVGFGGGSTVFYSFGANSTTVGTYTFQQIANNGSTTIPILNVFVTDASGNITILGSITKPGGAIPLLSTNTAITSGAAAQVATLLNGPVAGNPTKWVPISDNGTTRYIPAW